MLLISLCLLLTSLVSFVPSFCFVSFFLTITQTVIVFCGAAKHVSILKSTPCASARITLDHFPLIPPSDLSLPSQGQAALVVHVPAVRDQIPDWRPQPPCGTSHAVCFSTCHHCLLSSLPESATHLDFPLLLLRSFPPSWTAFASLHPSRMLGSFVLPLGRDGQRVHTGTFVVTVNTDHLLPPSRNKIRTQVLGAKKKNTPLPTPPSLHKDKVYSANTPRKISQTDSLHHQIHHTRKKRNKTTLKQKTPPTLSLSHTSTPKQR